MATKLAREVPDRIRLGGSVIIRPPGFRSLIRIYGSAKNINGGGSCTCRALLMSYVKSLVDPDPGSGAFLTPGSGMGRKSASGSGIRDEQPGSYFLELRNHFFGVKIYKIVLKIARIRDGDSSDPGSGMEKSRIRDKHPGSATLITTYFSYVKSLKIYLNSNIKIRNRTYKIPKLVTGFEKF
jgi:hypothetical protein